MNLPVFQQLKYISYSTWSQWKNCQHRVYLTRLAGHPFMEQDQGRAAAIGSVFDAFIKDAVCRKKNMSHPLTLDFLLKKNVTVKQDRDEIIRIGREIAVAYTKTGLFNRLINDSSLRVEQELYFIKGGIPILGQLDFVHLGLPHDLKTRGFVGTNKYSPHKGYSYKFDQDGVEHGWHPEKNQHFFENINQDWAAQLCFYNWVLRIDGNEYKGIIDEVCKTEHGINFVRHEALISKKFEESLWKRVEEMWSAIYDNLFFAKIVPPSASSPVCESYGSLCPASHLCNEYKRTLGDPSRRQNYVKNTMFG